MTASALNRPSVALATCRNLPAHEHDDARFEASLKERAEVTLAAWDDERVDWSRFDAVLVRTTWDYTERLEEFLAWCDQVDAATLLLNPAALIRWNSDKRYLKELNEAGLPTIPTIWGVGAELDVQAWAARLRASSASIGFVKPVVGANSSGTRRVALERPEALSEIARWLGRSPQRERSWMLQPYVSSVETSGEISLIGFNGKVSHAVRKIPVAGDYRVQDDWGARDEPFDWRQEAPELTELYESAQRLITERFDQGAALYARLDLLYSTERERFEVIELEMIEPSLFFRHAEEGLGEQRLIEALMARVG